MKKGIDPPIKIPKHIGNKNRSGSVFANLNGTMYEPNKTPAKEARTIPFLLKLPFWLSIRETHITQTANSVTPKIARSIELTDSLKKTNPQRNDTMIAPAIQMGTAIESLEYLMAYTDNKFPRAQKKPDNNPSQENVRF